MNTLFGMIELVYNVLLGSYYEHALLVEIGNKVVYYMLNDELWTWYHTWIIFLVAKSH